MANINFPPFPTIGDAYTFSFFTWIWNGKGWALNNLNGTNGSSPFAQIIYVWITTPLPAPQVGFTVITYV